MMITDYLANDPAHRALLRAMVLNGAEGYSPKRLPRAEARTQQNAQTIMGVLSSARLPMTMGDIRKWVTLDSYEIQGALRHLLKIGLVQFHRRIRRYQSHFLVRDGSAYAVRPVRPCEPLERSRSEVTLRLFEQVLDRSLTRIEMDRLIAGLGEDSDFVPFSFGAER